jgi:hypothetical protein
MRMQEMITEFRAIMPRLTRRAESMNRLFDKLQATGVDLKICTNSHSKEVLVEDMLVTLSDALVQIVDTLDCVRELQKLNEEYQHKVGRRVDKPKDDPRQMELQFDGATDNADNG